MLDDIIFIVHLMRKRERLEAFCVKNKQEYGRWKKKNVL